MEKFVIKDIDRNKSYYYLLPKKESKKIPVYAGNDCACQYGYNCDESFDKTKPLYYQDVAIDDVRTKIIL